MISRRLLMSYCSMLLCSSAAYSADGNRLAYLNDMHPYYPHTTFPKLVTPQWVGDEGVEAVIVLAIDDMRETAKYEAYLRPILQRLKAIDGRAPVSIMTCKADAQEDQLQAWINEGLSIEIHTRDHPCPLLKDGDFAKAKQTYEVCIDEMFSIPNNAPVAYRMPCCDSLNTVSPRFFAEIFNRRTPQRHFLQIDTSVFNVFTSADPEIPREVLFDSDGKPTFDKYVPRDRSFVNTIENYPYPYVIGNVCWEFPCLAPSDWSAQHYHQNVNDERTVRDLKTAIDLTVAKRGVLNLVFHPHGWIRNDQVIELIDHAVNVHGTKIKFLTFREALDRLNRNLLAGRSLRDAEGNDASIRLVDVDNDGYLDVLIPEREGTLRTRLWQPQARAWRESTVDSAWYPGKTSSRVDVQFAILDPSGRVSTFAGRDGDQQAWRFDGENWIADVALSGVGDPQDVFTRLTSREGRIQPVQFRDLDGDGVTEFLNISADAAGIWKIGDRGEWQKLSFTFPAGVAWLTPDGNDSGLRFVDINEDGRDDLVFSNHERYGIWLWKDLQTGWSIEVTSGKRGDKPPADEIPPIVRQDGTDNGVWFHSGHLWVQNEDTAGLPNLVDRRPFDKLLAGLPPQPKEPVAALQSMHVKPGFRIELVAAEPLVTDPVAIDWGPDGKLWVAEMSDYPNGSPDNGPPLGRVKFLQDTDGDGRYDKATIFLDRIPYPNGVLAWKNGVLVSAAPDILYAEDQNGDGRADLKDVLYTGFAPGNPQHRVNGFTRGLDNWLHVANGDSGGVVRSTRTGKEVDIRGRDVRIRPSDGAIEATTGQTQFGRNRDDWGLWIGNNNSHPVFHYVLEDHYLRRNPHFAPPPARIEVRDPPGNAPVFPRSVTLERFNDWHTANRFTSACSTNFYRDTLFGSSYYGNLFVCEPVHNLVSRCVVRPNEVSFTAVRADDEQDREFLASTDNWFRPAQVKTGPDGALWIVDMYRYVIEHPEWIPADWQKRLNLRAGEDRGRIYRIVPENATPRAIPQLVNAATAELVEALASPNGWERDLAQELLIDRGDRTAVPLLANCALQHASPLARLHALCTLDGMRQSDEQLLLAALGDREPGVRRHAVRISETLLADSPRLRAAISGLASDSDPLVRLQVAYSLGEWDGDAGAALASLALEHSDDPYLVAAVLSSLHPENVAGAMETVLTGASPEQSSLVDRMLAQTVAMSNVETLLALLRSALSDGDAWTPTRLRGIENILATANRSRKELSTLLEQESQLKARLDSLYDFLRERLAGDAPEPGELGVAARLLGYDRGRRSENLRILAGFLGPQYSLDVQLAVISALSERTDAEVADVFLAAWNSSLPTIKSRLLESLLSRNDWTIALLKGIESGGVSAAEFDASRRQQLLSHREASVRDVATRVLAGSVDSNRQAVIERYDRETPSAGDAAAGRAVFEKRCSVCHRLEEKGHAIGPDLAALKDRSRPAMLTAIFDPNRAVESKFLSYVAVTLDGKSHTGMLAEESGNSVTLVAQENKRVTLLRNEIEELVSTRKSLMPEGLEKDLSPNETADLFAFFDAVARPPKKLAGNAPRLVTADSDGEFVLAASVAEIYGPSLVFETRYQNLGYWTSTDDYAVWTLEIPEGGTYEIRLNYACDNSTAGNMLLLDAGGQSLTMRIPGTGSWDNYRTRPLGRLDLKPGRQRWVVSSGSELKNALLDLREIRLTRIE